MNPEAPARSNPTSSTFRNTPRSSTSTETAYLRGAPSTSPRALDLLDRTGRRQEPMQPRLPTEMLRVRDRVRDFAPVSSTYPRARATWIWCRDEEGHRRLGAAAALATVRNAPAEP
ncbi:hypothetical protein PUR71_11250 [Streptomyces sp. SP17BM10]|uniref:hypothetical protein n=1 Tax=Streptomyces sp. SP17BM10 TaxID=3002530 RepID=UPI002E77ECB4|nr:hypothetical protein [Streptomyces sp. SP17BM10]MEE1783480.1 hypothetical protein [Streptomyces sp. SP17BM10]